MKHHHPVPITLLTNDNNLSIKTRANGIQVLSANNEPLSSDALIRQVIHGPLPVEKTYIRPKEGEDTRMLDLSGTMEDKITFLPGLTASRHAPKSGKKENKPRVAINPQTGAVILLKDDERPPNHHARNYKELEDLLQQQHSDGGYSNGNTYADIMALSDHSPIDLSEEMEWE